MFMITGSTRLAALYATPARHSVSPLMHNTAFQALGIDAVYLAFEVGTKELPQAIQMIREFDMLGVNLSMPNKTAALALVDEVSPAGKLIGGINTIVNQQGHLVGHNTDGIGFMRSLQEADIQVPRKMTILGGGAAATAIMVQAALDGVAEIAVFNRRSTSYSRIEAKLQEIAKETGKVLTLYDSADAVALENALKDSQLLVNGTNIGMAELANECPLDPKLLHPALAVADIIYEPRETVLLKEAKKIGAKTTNGLGMLLYQGAAAFSLWTGQAMPVEKIKPLMK